MYVSIIDNYIQLIDQTQNSQLFKSNTQRINKKICKKKFHNKELKFKYITLIKMSLEPKHYLKLCFNKLLLEKHIPFAIVKHKISNLQFLIEASMSINSKQLDDKAISIKLKQILTEDGSVFYQIHQRWDCIQLNKQIIGSRPQLQLKFILSGILSANQIKKQVEASHINSLIEETIIQNSTKKINYCKQISVMSISLDQFIKQPYKYHNVNLDFGISDGEKNNYDDAIKNQRYGMLNFEICYLKQLNTQLLIKNIRLKTKKFYKNYKFGMYQVLTNRLIKQNESGIYELFKKIDDNKYYHQVYRNNTMRQVYNNHKLKVNNIEINYIEIPLQVDEWQQFKSKQSFSRPIILPIYISNDNDKIAISLQFEMQDLNVNMKKQNKNKNQYNKNNQKSKKKQESNANQVNTENQKQIHTLQNMIKIQSLLSKSDYPKQWKKQSISYQILSYQFLIEYELMLKITKGIQPSSTKQLGLNSNIQHTISQLKQYQQQNFQYLK